jgi:sigma-B regulation protein RsbU (phosphoserine phosphatase)
LRKDYDLATAFHNSVDIESHPRLGEWLRRGAAAASIAVAVMGALGLVGCAGMKVGTALGFLLSAISLWFLRRDPGQLSENHRAIGRTTASLVALLGLLAMVEYIFDWNSGFDHLFHPAPASAPTASPGRMAPITGFDFLLIGFALLAINVQIQGRFWPAQLLSVTAVFLSLIEILGYLYGAGSLPGITDQTRMPLHAAIGFLLLSLGNLWAQPNRGLMAMFNSDSAGGEMARRLLPAAVLIPAFLGGLRIWLRKAGLLHDVETEVAALMVVTMFVFGVIIWFNAQWLYRADIKRKRVEEAFSQERYLMNTLMDNIPDHIYFKDRQSRFLRINKSMAKLFNLDDPSQAVGKTDSDFFTSEHAEQARRDEQRIMETGHALRGKEEKETWPDGTVTWVSSTKECLRDARGEVIGTFGISRDITARKLAEERLRKHTAELRHKNEQIEEELKMARELQLALLPQEFPSLPRNAAPRDSALRFFSFYHPTGSVSGDYFDVFPLSDTSAGMFICDVMGHGVRAALVTAMMHAFVQDFNARAGDPGALLTEVNHGLTAILKQTGTTLYATAFYLVADVARGRMFYANAGHPSPLHVQRSTGQVEPLRTNGKTGPALGLFKDATYQTCEQPISAGDILLLFTDGLFEVEGRNDEQYTQERLLAAVRKRVKLGPAELVRDVLAEVKEFSVHKGFDDDVCLVGAEVERLVVPETELQTAALSAQ